MNGVTTPNEAGVTLNIRIAEFLGATWLQEAGTLAEWLSFPEDRAKAKPIHRRVLASRFADGTIAPWAALEDYSRLMADAWTVVEHMRNSDNVPARFKSLSLVAYSYNRTYATFDAEKFTGGEGWIEANGEHATPLAICLAALAATPFLLTSKTTDE